MVLEMQPAGRGGKTRGGKGLNLTLSPATLTLVGVGVVLVLGWCFYMGFMIGRGQNPEEHLQKIAAVWQAEERGATVAGVEAGSSAESAEGVPQTSAQGAEGAAQDPGQVLPGTTPGAVPGYPAFASSQPAPQGTTVEQTPSQGASLTQAQGAQPKAQQTRAPGTHTYVYRMATVRNQEDARREQERYENKGFRVRIVKSGNVWVLRHEFQGTDEDEKAFLQAVKNAGLGQPLRTSRK